MDSRPIALYDANVLYPAQLRDLLMRLAVGGLVRAHWSGQIHEEWMLNVVGNYSDISREDVEYTRSQMDRALPDAQVTGHKHLIEDLSLPDPDDNHVLAAAIHAETDYIITFNLEDFPDAKLRTHGVKAIHPDVLMSTLMSSSMEKLLKVVKRHRTSLRKPPLDREEYLEVLKATGLEKTVEKLEAHQDRL